MNSINGISIEYEPDRSKVSGFSLEHSTLDSRMFGFSIEYDSPNDKVYGFSIEHSFDLMVRITDGVGSSIDTRLELYQGSQLLEAKESINGTVSFTLNKAGIYKIKAINSDTTKLITYDGKNKIFNTYTLFNKTMVYRIKVKGEDTYSKELILKI
ncbi:hypothetical protein [Reichenbachiella versicolor]|uniref:hypothetical protein n=1 Tax=Reichenbachiella versicolor TaxID=1821036 RepID=UPI000D6E4C09|nr:hypothetical protein [Reichenbachiella versicolor]